jgi:hypothetical protein
VSRKLRPPRKANFPPEPPGETPIWGDHESDGIGDRDSGTNIRYAVSTAPSYLHFLFDEITLDYLAGPMSLDDGDSDGLPDVWAAYHGVAGGNGNPDNDPFSNAQELARGTDPNVPDSYISSFPELRLVGSFTGWSPETSPVMALSGDNTWSADIFIADPAGAEFKFVAGDSWSSTNWANGEGNGSLPDQGAGTYRSTVDDVTRAFTVERRRNTFADRYPGLTPGQLIRGRPALLEHLFGGSSMHPPEVGNLPLTEKLPGKLRMTFVARADDNALIHRVTTATDLNADRRTTDEVTVVSQENLPDGLQRRVYEVPAVGAQRFLRIEAEMR